ncbi:AAA family ATPase [bacterium]|nr:AAA family ATPase [bacterium]
MSRKQRVVITGAPGSGKTTLLHALRTRGASCRRNSPARHASGTGPPPQR